MSKLLDLIPVDLRNKLDGDADRAAANRDRKCAEILRQLAAYQGNDAPQFARDLGAEACTARYPSAMELMRLVFIAEQEREKKDETRQHP
jgi:hypothetical protein